MSIAVSVVVKPSRLVFAMVGFICLISVLIGLAVAFGRIGEPGFTARTAFVCVTIGAAVRGLYYLKRMGKAHHIDISGIGQIRLVETTALADPAFCNEAPETMRAGVSVSLMDDSTLWPFLLLLRLQAEDGRITTLIVLPDTVDRPGFRALSVACRWIVAHRGPDRHSDSSKMLG